MNFSSYNYLGLSGDPRVVEATQAAVAKYGTSVSASRVASGERPFHHELEALLAGCQDTEDSVVFTAGHATNMAAIGHLMGKGDLVLHDELIHDSILQGIKLAGCARRGFKHDDPTDLENQLRELRPHYEKVLIVVEGVYSMDGDICDMPSYIRLKKKYGCLLMCDEAHSFGVVGATGQGVREHFGFPGTDVDIWMGTLSKSVASCGGWIAGRAPLIRYLRYTAPGFVYSAGITPANGTAALSSLSVMLKEPWRVEKLQANAQHFHDELVKRGIDTGPAKGGSAVVPAITGNSLHALLLSQRLNRAGVNVQPIVYPAVADDAARLRFFLSSTHSFEQLERTAELVATTLAGIREEYPIPL
ncbi:MAG: aminotransferase class I/II-fold pyridoxal phosphate-dependent enzyme [Alphaproteobacteria bacterium]|nr:aminotransferase class I/II-fold pyridoxal phosphate-dependent enzyme [Alphaproteobacteria bacterium]